MPTLGNYEETALLYLTGNMVMLECDSCGLKRRTQDISGDRRGHRSSLK